MSVVCCMSTIARAEIWSIKSLPSVLEDARIKKSCTSGHYEVESLYVPQEETEYLVSCKYKTTVLNASYLMKTSRRNRLIWGSTYYLLAILA